MRADDLQHDRVIPAEGGQDLLALDHVTLDLLELGLRQHLGLVQQLIPGPDLPDVVQLTTQPDLLKQVAGHPQLHRRLGGVDGHSL